MNTPFPVARTCPFDPPPQYAAARTQAPLFAVTLWNGHRAWVVTRHAEVRTVLMDDKRFSGRMAQPDFPTVTQARVTVDRNERAFVGMDNPDHDRFRRFFTREFSVRRMQALIPRMEALANGLIDGLIAAGPPADLVSRVIAEHVLPGNLSRDDFAEIGAMILRAGHDTTTNMIGIGALLLLRDDALRSSLATDPPKVKAAVEEFLRFVAPVQFSPRRVAL